jgi:hypothetical protein
MASITSLPNELTDMIFAYLPFWSILGLSKTCKRLYKATLPLLYRDINMQWKGQSTSKRPKIEKLLRTLIEKPEVARMVKNIQLCARNCVFWTDDGALKLSRKITSVFMSREERRLYEHTIETLPLSQAEYWKEVIARDDNLYAIMPLVISQCTHLESLSTSILFLLDVDWLKDLIRYAVNSSQESRQLSKLARVTVTSDAYGDDWTTEPLSLKETLLYLFYLPNMSTLDLTAIADDPEPLHHLHQIPVAKFWPLNIPTAHNLNTLHLRRSQVSPNILGYLLKQTPNLRILRYDCFKPASSGRLDLTALRAGLQNVRSTLTDLIVRFDMYTDNDSWAIEEVPSACIGRLGSLHDLTALATLSVSYVLLFGELGVTPVHEQQLAYVLPQQLQKLTLYDDLWGYEAFGTTEGVPLMETFEDYFRGDPIGVAHQPNQDAQRTRLADSCLGTLELTEFVLDIRSRRWAYDSYWKDLDTKLKLERVCNDTGITCTIRE